MRISTVLLDLFYNPNLEKVISYTLSMASEKVLNTNTDIKESNGTYPGQLFNIKPISVSVSTFLVECQKTTIIRPAAPIYLDVPLMSTVTFNLSLLNFSFYYCPKITGGQ